jgi:hypothetical protein
LRTLSVGFARKTAKNRNCPGGAEFDLAGAEEFFQRIAEGGDVLRRGGERAAFTTLLDLMVGVGGLAINRVPRKF